MCANSHVRSEERVKGYAGGMSLELLFSMNYRCGIEVKEVKLNLVGDG